MLITAQPKVYHTIPRPYSNGSILVVGCEVETVEFEGKRLAREQATFKIAPDSTTGDEEDSVVQPLEKVQILNVSYQ